MKKFKEAPDVTFSNPPYTDNKDLKIIKALVEANYLKKLICVHPSTWLISQKNKIGKGLKLFNEIKVRNNLKKVYFFNGNIVFNIFLTNKCIISEFDFNSYFDKVEVFFNNNSSKFCNILDISVHEINYEIIEDFFKKIIKFSKNNNLFMNVTKKEEEIYDNFFYVQLSKLRGNIDSFNKKFLQESFFTFLQKDVEKNKGIRFKDNINVFKFNSEVEQENFLKYLQTDFARLCLSLIKCNFGLGDSELTLIPWLDWTKSLTDDELFSFFGFKKGHPLREYTKTFLPDYHNIYPNGKDY